MKVAPGNYTITCSAIFVFTMLSSQANAACSRDDVNFYLDKGFTTDQITALCSEASTPVSGSAKSEQLNSKQQAVSPAADDNALFLNRAIKAQEINLSSDSLSYTQKKMCMEYGEEDLFGFTPKVCPDVIFTISLKGLEVLDTGKKYGFYGAPEVRVKSSVIKREIIGELKDKKPEERELILDVFEKGFETAIPIRDDFSLEQVKQVLLELSN
ncbi:MAG: hypothetical protein DRQ44_18090 [Gammaproteobacteria bacterium]|nr:MAG: hypothetical protein DRQ44_18090 [Gammaproteobacteria bacterium]